MAGTPGSTSFINGTGTGSGGFQFYNDLSSSSVELFTIDPDGGISANSLNLNSYTSIDTSGNIACQALNVNNSSGTTNITMEGATGDITITDGNITCQSADITAGSITTTGAIISNGYTTVGNNGYLEGRFLGANGPMDNLGQHGAFINYNNNNNGGNGYTSFINNYGTGAGGWYFYNIPPYFAGSSAKALVEIDNTGSIITSGDITCQSVTVTSDERLKRKYYRFG